LNNTPESSASAELRATARPLERYEALSSLPGVVVWVIDRDLRPVAANSAWERYTGQAHVDYDDRGWMTAVHPDDRLRLQQEISGAFTSRQAFITELRIRRADGRFRRNIIRAVPILRADQIVEWIGTATDIEDARQAADDLQAFEVRMRVAHAAAGIGTWEWQFDGNRLTWSSEVFHMLGLDESSEPDVGVWMQHLHPDDGPGARARWAAALAGPDTSFSDTFRMIGADGTSRWILSSAVIFRFPSGEPARAVGLNIDITSHKTLQAQLEAALLKSQRQAARMAYLAEASAVLGSLEYESTLQQIARMAVPSITDWCAVDLLDEHSHLQRIVTAHVDPGKVALALELETRYPTDPASSSGVAGVLRTGQPEFYPHVSDEMLASGAVDAEHLAMLRALGLHSILIAPLSARGRTLGAISFVCSDDRALTHDDATVLTEVARRAALAIDNARLFREAETANRLKDDFLAILSHELRTPLNAIMGWTHMLRQGLPAESHAHAFEVISRNAQSQRQLVEDLLDVARIAAGAMDLNRGPLDLRDSAAAAADSVVPAADAKGIRLQLSCASRPVVVDADPNRIQQVTANLLGNALKFTEPGGEVVVSVSASDGWAEFVVRDTGVGIAREVLPHIFERFRQADTSLSRPYPGLGLGLWVVKQIVEAHQGTVEAESEGPGAGTTVRVRVPLADAR
jgi:PAS domain S-box-containing protein